MACQPMTKNKRVNKEISNSDNARIVNKFKFDDGYPLESIWLKVKVFTERCILHSSLYLNW